MREVGNADRREVGHRLNTIGGEFSSAVSTTRKSHAPVSKYEDAA
jgi:hypothetical protein